MSENAQILIVDDEPYIVRSLSFVLKRAGYGVLQARDGREALEMIRTRRPGLVFLDIMLPEKDGYEVCREIKEDPELAGTYVIMLTAKHQELDEERALGAGAQEYMTKPFSPSHALERVDAVLGGSS